jgi:hypothetical protein
LERNTPSLNDWGARQNKVQFRFEGSSGWGAV